MAILGYVPEKMGHELVNLILIIQIMVIVEDEDKVFGYLLIDLIDQGGYQWVHVSPPIGGTVEKSRCSDTELRIGLLYGSDQVVKKDTGVPIEWVEGIPANGEVCVVGKVNQERGLAVARGS